MSLGKKIKFKAKFHGNDKLTTGNRKKDSNYYRRKIANKKVAYISHLIKNTNQLLIVSAITYPQVRPGLIDRFLILAERENVRPIIILTKLDLEGKAEYPCEYSSKDLQTIYQQIGYKVILLSNFNDRYQDVITDLLKDKRTAVVGHSGVGKTTLLNNLDPTFSQEVKEVSSFTRRGRHTTNKIRLHNFSFGGLVYDMPGLKEIDFFDIRPNELTHYYLEFVAHSRKCQFTDCLHRQEKSCEVKTALNNKLISFVRYQSYLNILKDLEKK